VIDVEASRKAADGEVGPSSEAQGYSRFGGVAGCPDCDFFHGKWRGRDSAPDHAV
jgi:hypothetical protein